MSRKIKIVTDSTADLPPEYVQRHNIHVVPLYVNFSQKTYRDGVDLCPEEFYPLLKEAKDDVPKTSTPTIDDFVQAYESILKEGYDILSIHISSGLSSTASIAEAAAKKLSGVIHVFDSKSISLGIGVQIAEALEMLQKNTPLDTILTRLQEIRRRTEVLFSLDTLEYLQKGGRIGKVSALLGTILNIKPVVRVENGIYIPLDKVRNQNQAIKKMVNHMLATLDGKMPKQIGVAHGVAAESAHALKQLIEEKLQQKISFFNEVGPVVGVHTGPGTLGLVFLY